MGQSASKIEIIYQQVRIEKQLRKADDEVPKAFADMVEKIQAMDMVQLRQSKGLGWEKIPGRLHVGQQTYSLRINSDWRALCVLQTGPQIEILFIAKHDASYRCR